MKKILALMILISTFSLAAVYGQNPIPSWNIPVYHRANFQETSKKISGQGDQVMGKRVLNVHAQTGSNGPQNCGTVYIYRLDSTMVMGPCTLCEGQTLSVEIDQNEWGVLVESEAHLVIDVWID